MAGLPLLAPHAAPQPMLHVWRGSALGANAELQLHHPDPAEARRLIRDSLDEVARLERQLSLYQPDSALLRLNRDGALAAPPFDLLRLLAEAARFHALTDGAFDVTVQPLWDLYAGHFARAGADPAGPPAEAVAAALDRVGQHRIHLDADQITLRPGTAITLNGIAQGYVTDRVVERLRANGITQALVDMGEARALGGHPMGDAWQVGLEDPAAPGQIAETIPLRNRAVATSGGYGTRFDAAGRFNHIFDPADGRSSWRYAAISVIAPDATTADALSTAFSLLPPERVAELARQAGVTVHVARTDGTRVILA
ncbi:FAD:protein FMN transferase [Rhodovastum atsumiense]|uniref:FAD:protein FMN transferase n=2 Tax=Rhodovastum atsumiense TaxID=504468 RepID=A0A5M6IXD2_9PROT|nr:FAD:protein FMN transferase [Rhodovastum atsumiense]